MRTIVVVHRAVADAVVFTDHITHDASGLLVRPVQSLLSSCMAYSTRLCTGFQTIAGIGQGGHDHLMA